MKKIWCSSLDVSSNSTSSACAAPSNTTEWPLPAGYPQNFALSQSSTSYGQLAEGKKIRIDVEEIIRPSRIRKVPSSEALERRRRQNRAAQLASRERTKKIVEELKGALTRCTEFNQEMCDKMQEVLEIADTLK